MHALGGRLKLIICGAAPVPERLMYGFKPYGVRVLSGYGMTETANLVSGNLEQERHPDSVARQYPCQEARIVEGKLQVKGDMLFGGYWKDEAATRAAFDGEWLKTGDLARIDEEGFIRIAGRIKNLILPGNGENVSPEEARPGLDPRAVSMESRLQADLGLDSMSGMVLLMEIEDAFQVELGEDANFETVGDVCRYLSAHRQA